jgi:hypothetical protein
VIDNEPVPPPVTTQTMPLVEKRVLASKDPDIVANCKLMGIELSLFTGLRCLYAVKNVVTLIVELV